MNQVTGFVEVPDARIYFERSGDGPSVLFLHAGVADLRMWDEQVQALQSRFDCISFDRRGFGRSENIAPSYSPMDDICAVMDELGVPSASVVGLSMGGAIAIELALDHAQRVSSLALIAAGVGGWSEWPNEDEMSELGRIDEAFEANDLDRAAALEVAYWLDGPGRSGRIQGEVRDKMFAMCRGAYGRDEPRADAVSMDPPAVTRLPQIAVPTLAIAGTFDESTILSVANEFEKQIPTCRKIIYEGVAHMVNLEQPQRFNADLLAFLSDI
ncbi:MAG: alpha/beta fold hydrolase [Actinomycetota bacterium]